METNGNSNNEGFGCGCLIIGIIGLLAFLYGGDILSGLYIITFFKYASVLKTVIVLSLLFIPLLLIITISIYQRIKDKNNHEAVSGGFFLSLAIFVIWFLLVNIAGCNEYEENRPPEKFTDVRPGETEQQYWKRMNDALELIEKDNRKKEWEKNWKK